MTKTHWKKLRNHKYLGSHDLYNTNGEKVEIDTRVIRVQSEMVANQDGKEEACIVAHLEGTKPMILNSTNCKKIEGFANSPIIESWAGVAVTVKIERVRAFGEWHEALRIAPTQPKLTEPKPTEKPILNQESEQWQTAKEYYQNQADKAKAERTIKAKYTITPGDWAELIAQ
jgi:hypothetical protein